MAGAEVKEYPTGAVQRDNFWKIRNRRLAKVPLKQLTVDDIRPVKVIFADHNYKSAIPGPEKVREIMDTLIRHSDILDDSAKTAQAIWNTIAAPTTMIWEVPDKALFYATDIIAGHMAFVHIVVYDRDAMRQYTLLRELMRVVMDHPLLQLQRLNAFIPGSNRKAIWLARCLGFRREGILRRWTMRNGQYVDLITLGILRKELDEDGSGI